MALDRRRTRRAAAPLPLLLELDPGRAEPLGRQAYLGLRQAILDGRIRPGARLPSTRDLARDLGVSRNTLLLAFQQLGAEGYLVGRVGSGTRVSTELPDDLAHPVGPAPRAEPRSWYGGPEPLPSNRDARSLSTRAAVLAALPTRLSRLPPGPLRPFTPGTPDLGTPPVELLGRLVARRWRDASPGDLDYGDPAGPAPLREAIAARLFATRGARVEPARILIVSGAQAALDLAARLVVDPGDAVWVEDPGYPAARAALLAAGARIEPVPVDLDGMDVDAALASGPARLAYVTPSHQFPLGVTLGLRRRLALLRWARDTGAFVLEDDYDSEFHYAKRPLSALLALDSADRVLHAGTFSKSLFPSLRVGYLVVPPALREPALALRRAIDVMPSPVLLAALADLLEGGHFDRHVRRMRQIYRERQRALLTACREELLGRLEIAGHDAGLHVTALLPPGESDEAASVSAAAAGIDAIPLSAFALGPLPRGGLLLGFAAFTPEEIRAGVARLARALG